MTSEVTKNRKRKGKQSEDQRLLNKLSGMNPNIVVTSMNQTKQKSKLTKNQKYIGQKIDQKEQEINRVILLRDEYNKKTRDMYNLAKESRELRDKFNQEKARLRKIKKEAHDKKDELLSTKRNLALEIDNATNKKTKTAKYNELKEIRTQLDSAFERLNEVRTELQFNDEEGNKEHQNNLVYRKLAEQSKREADDYHQKVKLLRKELYKLKKEGYEVRQKSRSMNHS